MDALQLLKQRQGDVFASMATIMGAMAAPVRLRLIHFLSQAPLTVEVLAAKIDESLANTSMHLRKMLSEGLVKVEPIGKKRLYTLAPEVLEFWEHYQDFIQKLDPTLAIQTADVYGDINWGLDFAETKKLLKKNEVVLLDVRPDDESPLSDESDEVIKISQANLKKMLNALPKRKKILVFCRGRLCALSSYSVNYLRENGFKAYRLDASWYRIQKELL